MRCLCHGVRSLAFCAAVLAARLVAQAENLPPAYDLDPTAEHPRSSEGSFADLANGRILFEYSQFTGGGADYSPSAIGEIYSDDQGKTWSKPRIAVPTGTFQNVMSVSLLRLQSGKLARFHVVKKTKWLDCHPVVSFSGDDGASWSDPKPITTAPGYFVLNNDRVIQTKTGRLIVPLGFHRSKSDRDDESAWDAHALDIWYYSDDDGATWKESSTWWALPVASGSGMQEPGVVQLTDGSLFSWCRTDVGTAYESRSRDNGLTWSAPQPTDLKSPNSPASIKLLPNSATLLCVYNDHSGRFPFPAKRRSPLVLAFSTDGGATWKNQQPIETDLKGWYCYSAIHYTKEGVLLAYVAGNDEIGKLSRLRIRRIPFASLNLPGR